MDTENELMMMKIYLGESDHHHGKPLYKYILEMLKERGIAGATVFRGISGFGKTSIIHTTSILRLSTDMPILIEVVDERSKLNAIKEELASIMQEGLITEEKITVVFYKGNGNKQ